MGGPEGTILILDRDGTTIATCKISEGLGYTCGSYSALQRFYYLCKNLSFCMWAVVAGIDQYSSYLISAWYRGKY